MDALATYVCSQPWWTTAVRGTKERQGKEQEGTEGGTEEGMEGKREKSKEEVINGLAGTEYSNSNWLLHWRVQSDAVVVGISPY